MSEQLITSMLVAGATAFAQVFASDATKAAYNSLRDYIRHKLPRVSSTLTKIERQPESEDLRVELARILKTIDPVTMAELIKLVDHLRASLDASPGNDSSYETSSLGHDSEPWQTPIPIFLDITSKVKLLARLPLGPAVDTTLVPVDSIAEDLSREQNYARAHAVVQNANRLRQMVDPRFPKASICITDLPDPRQGLYSYWWEVLDQSLVKGPRMAGALLLNLPLQVWMRHGRVAYRAIEGG